MFENKRKERLLEIMNQNFNKNDCRLDRDLKGKKVVIYGCGNMGYLTFEKIHKIARVAGVIDQSEKKAKYYHVLEKYDVPVFRLGNEPQEVKDDKENIILLVSICMQYHDYMEFASRMKREGYQNIYYSRMYSYEQVYQDSRGEIEQAFDLLADAESQELYLQLLGTGGGISNLLNSQWEQQAKDQYFPLGIKMKKGYGRFVDCGAYIGDTIEKLIDIKGGIEAVAAFEPGEDNYKKLEDCMCFINADEKKSYPYAVGLESGFVDFNNELDDGCCIVNTASGQGGGGESSGYSIG